MILPEPSKTERPSQPEGGRITTLIYRIIMPVSERINAQVGQYGFNIAAARVLDTLLSLGPTRAGKLCKLTGIDNSTLSHLLKKLENLEYIERARLKNDNRSVIVTLTPSGEDVAAFVASLSNENEDILLDGFSPDDVRLLKDLLRRVLSNTESNFQSANKLRMRPEAADLDRAIDG